MTKVLNAQQAGAAAVLIHNNVGHDALVIMGGYSTSINIPAVFVSRDTGALLRERCDAGVTDGSEKSTALRVKLAACHEDSSYGRHRAVYIPDGVLLILIFMTVVCAMCMVAIIRWRVHHLYLDSAPPVERRVVINFPQRTIEVDEEAECIICLEGFEAGNSLRTLPCGHEYHTQCIDKWLTSQHRTCPICKADVTLTEEEVGGARDDQNMHCGCCNNFRGLLEVHTVPAEAEENVSLTSQAGREGERGEQGEVDLELQIIGSDEEGDPLAASAMALPSGSNGTGPQALGLAEATTAPALGTAHARAQ